MKQNLFREYTEEEIINLIQENKVEEDLKELLISSINCNKNKIVKALLDLNVPFDYTDNIGYNAHFIAVTRGNLEALRMLEDKGLDLFRTYNIDKEDITALSLIRDLDTLKFYETKTQSQDIIKDNIERIANNTIVLHNLELLKYLVNKYNLDLKKVSYETPSKKYTILEKSQEILESMKEKLIRKREMTFFADDLLYGEESYDRIIKKAYDRLNEFELEVKEIEEYCNYIKTFYNE